MNRVHQVVLIGAVLLGSWLGMQAVHELGHVLAARLTGGRVSRIVFTPLTLSRTELVDNPSPLVVVCGGPVVGVLLPLVLWITAAVSRIPGAFVLRFFAGFCLVANGAYIAGGSFDQIGDCGEMLRYLVTLALRRGYDPVRVMAVASPGNSFRPRPGSWKGQLWHCVSELGSLSHISHAWVSFRWRVG